MGRVALSRVEDVIRLIDERTPAPGPRGDHIGGEHECIPREED